MSTETTIKAVRETRINGVGKLAMEMGVSRHHLACVLHGRRKPGPELAAKLAERGIKPEALKPEDERWV